jgi:hypothetical protein
MVTSPRLVAATIQFTRTSMNEVPLSGVFTSVRTQTVSRAVVPSLIEIGADSYGPSAVSVKP